MSQQEKNLVYIVDDNEAGRYGKGRILRRAGFDVVEFENGENFLRALQSRQPRLVVLDINLPDIDGWEICRRIKADPESARVLVLQVSATHIKEADTVRSLEGGADGCLTEPIEPAVLIATARALMRAREAEDALREALAREQLARGSAEAASRAKDEFLATLSHEIRSPLGAILNWTTLLRGGRLDEAKKTRALEAIERNTRLQIKLVDDLLDVSRIISGKMLLEVALVELKGVVDGALESVRPAAQSKSIRVDSSVDPTQGPVSGDAGRLQQVVWNLLSNAVKFTPKGGQVGIQVSGVDSQVEIKVSDSGKGIEASFLPHIFERFRQADASPTREEGGLGLGLAIVRHLVELHGGTVHAESAGLGKGSTFTVRLPLPAIRIASVASPRAQVTPMPRAPERAAELGGLHILVVDDQADAREAIGLVLGQHGAEVSAVGSVDEAFARLGHVLPDVIVSDIAMPHEDGYAFIRRLRQLGPERGGRVPAIALTAYARQIDRKEILAAGFQACLTKPIDAAELAVEIERIVRRSALG